MTATRYADHYKGDSAGYFDDIEYIAINDNTARMNALMTGQVDAINRIDFKPKACCANPCAFKKYQASSTIFLMLTNVAPFGDVNAPRAKVRSGPPRDGGQNQGHGTVGNDSPIGPANQYYHAEMEQLEFDPDKSKFYLRNLDSPDIDLSAPMRRLRALLTSSSSVCIARNQHQRGAGTG
jgi:peptide/nickel transport system substrate-binding protein